MKHVVLILSLLVPSTPASARYDDLVSDLTSAGYAPIVARNIVAQAHPASLPLIRRNVSFVTTQQLTADLASAGYGPAGLTNAAPAEQAAHPKLPPTRVDYRTADVIRADLKSAGYAPSADGLNAITSSAKG